ncbi:MAG: 2-C-methyl-D-erythritol 4-phosphate cytidylyltransferase [Gammaproteobacteria bacterium]|nr:2-C-methyl-D-erythritol 4-phosphate cytidylyltransferase [Gammaproteobacteria bacterium]
MSERCWAVIPAAGVGRRMASATPKQYMQVAGKTVLEHTLNILLAQAEITGAIIALSEKDEYWQDLHYQSEKPLLHANGGQERFHSVLNALKTLQETASLNDWVLVHDAARPCVSSADLKRLISTVKKQNRGGLLACRVRDTMKRSGVNDRVVATENRENLWHALTPQMFRLGELVEAIESAIAGQVDMTDDASAMELFGYQPLLVEGSHANIKITHPEDLLVAEAILKN